MTVLFASWWPPKVGDRLRRFTLHGAGGMRVKQVHALVRVVAVFEHDGEIHATVAEWFPTRRRWHYETIQGWCGPAIGEYWPDGQPPPPEHRPCDACKSSTEESDSSCTSPED